MSRKIKTGLLCGKYRVLKEGKKYKLPRIYVIWSMMKQRVYNKNHLYYKNYGGRGILVCDDWLGTNGFENFYTDMNTSYEKQFKIYGKKNTTLDRINNDGNYCKSNCKWSTQKEQANNTRVSYKTRIVFLDGKKYQLVKLAKTLNIRPQYLVQQLKEGWTKAELQLGFRERQMHINQRTFFLDNNYLNLKNLPSRTKAIITYKYFKGMYKSNIQVGKKFNLSRERIRQLLNKSINIIKYV